MSTLAPYVLSAIRRSSSSSTANMLSTLAHSPRVPQPQHRKRRWSMPVCIASLFILACSEGVASTLVDVKDRLTSLRGEATSKGLTQISDKIDKILAILTPEPDSVSDLAVGNLATYKLNYIMRILGTGDDGTSISITNLLAEAAPPVGHPGEYTGNATLHSCLNSVIDLMTESFIQIKFDEPLNHPLQDGNTLWSRLNWTTTRLHEDIVTLTDLGDRAADITKVNNVLAITGSSADNYSTDPYTVASLWQLIQTTRTEIAGLMDVNLVAILLNTLDTLDTQVTTLCSNVTLANVSDGSSLYTDALAAVLTSAQEIFQTSTAMYRSMEGAVHSLTVDTGTVDLYAGLVTHTNTTISSLSSGDPVNIGRIVHQVMYIFPQLMQAIQADPPELSLVGKYISAGLNLHNCLHNVLKVIHVDPILKKIGRTLDLASPVSLLGQINAKGTPTAYSADTLMLLYHLLDNYPVIGELDSGGSTPFYQYLNGVIGLRTDPLKDSGSKLFETLNKPSKFKTNVLTIYTKLNSMLSTAYQTKLSLGSLPTNFANYLGKLSWLNYHHIFASLLNDDTVDTTRLHKELIGTSLGFLFTGIPNIDDSISLKAKMLAGSPTGTPTDNWMSVGTDAELPTHYSSFNFVRKIICEGVDFLLLQQFTTANTIATAIKAITTNFDNIYSNLTTTFYSAIETYVKKTAGAPTGTVASKLAGKDDAFAKVTLIATTLEYCKNKAYPIDLVKIYFLLNDVDGTELDQLGNSPLDHPSDSSIYGKLNCVLYQTGAQLLLNLIGESTQAANEEYQTYYSTLIAKEYAQKTGTPAQAATITSNAHSIMERFDLLRGNISYFYASHVPGAAESRFDTLRDAINGYTETLAGVDLTQSVDATVLQLYNFAKYASGQLVP
jgi:hypothetical protein